jgi:hypothetical protein
MSQLAELRKLEAPPRPGAANWIIDRRTDLLLITGPVLIGYALLFLNVALGISSFLIWWFWQATANGSHFFATYSRTYLDRQEWRDRGSLLVGSLFWIGLGPLVLALDYVLGLRMLYSVLFLFWLGWAFYHVVRQDYGVICLYQRKNTEPSGARDRVEYWLFNVAMFGPFLVWLSLSPFARDVVSAFVDLPDMEGFASFVTWLSAPLILLAVSAYVAKALVNRVRYGVFNSPKVLFFMAYFSLRAVTNLVLPLPYAYDPFLFIAVQTYPHNIQYMTIVWHYNKKHYGADRGDFGLARSVNRSPGRFVLCSVLFGVIFYYCAWYFWGLRVPFLSAVSSLADSTFLGHRLGRYVEVMVLGVSFNHFHIDQEIWKVNRDAKVAQRLGVEPQKDLG